MAKPAAPRRSSLGPVAGSGTPVDGSDDLDGVGVGDDTAGGDDSGVGLAEVLAVGLATGEFSPRF